MEMEEQSRIELSSLTVDICTEDGSEDEYGTSTDDDDDEYETSTEEEEDDGGGGDAGPPIQYAEDLASPPEGILLDVQGYIDARKNSTTAYACLSTGRGAIQVTFWAARPPRVSCSTVHCDGVKSNEFCRFPMVLAAEDDLVLLHVTRRGRNLIYISEHFIYQAAGATSTLRLLANPHAFSGSNADILRLRDSEFLVAAIQLVVGTNGGQFDLHLFDSRTWTWTNRQMLVYMPQRYARTGFRPTKVLTLGGERGSMAWVDLWHGMLLCDLLAVHDDDTMLRYIPLPPSPSPSTEREGCPSDVRDIAVVQAHGEAAHHHQHRHLSYQILESYSMGDQDGSMAGLAQGLRARHFQGAGG